VRSGHRFSEFDVVFVLDFLVILFDFVLFRVRLVVGNRCVKL